MSLLVNLQRIGITEKDIKVYIEYLTIDKELNKELIQKTITLGNYVKRSENGE